MEKGSSKAKAISIITTIILAAASVFVSYLLIQKMNASLVSWIISSFLIIGVLTGGIIWIVHSFKFSDSESDEEEEEKPENIDESVKDSAIDQTDSDVEEENSSRSSDPRRRAESLDQFELEEPQAEKKIQKHSTAAEKASPKRRTAAERIPAKPSFSMNDTFSSETPAVQTEQSPEEDAPAQPAAAPADSSSFTPRKSENTEVAMDSNAHSKPAVAVHARTLTSAEIEELRRQAKNRLSSHPSDAKSSASSLDIPHRSASSMPALTHSQLAEIQKNHQESNS